WAPTCSTCISSSARRPWCRGHADEEHRKYGQSLSPRPRYPAEPAPAWHTVCFYVCLRIMKVAIVPVTPFQQNCSILVCEATRKAALVDPGGDLPRLRSALEEFD